MVPVVPSPKFQAYDAIEPSGSVPEPVNETGEPWTGAAGENVSDAVGWSLTVIDAVFVPNVPAPSTTVSVTV